jgi:Phosphodiester glycosidase
MKNALMRNAVFWLAVICAASVAAATPAAIPAVPAATTVTTPSASATAIVTSPLRVERFTRDGPMAGVIAQIDLSNPNVSIRLALADDRDPDGDGPCSGQLATTSQAAQKYDFDVTLNASFFAAPVTRELRGKSVRYFVGNCTTPVGWHVQKGRVITKPANERLRAAFVIDEDGRPSIIADLREVPAKARDVVSGNAMVLHKGEIVARDREGVRHPRSVVGLSQDGKTLYLVAVDGRQAAHSRGASMWELGELLKSLGATEAVNLDGGGSTALVLKDPRTGTFGVANQPSEVSTDGHPVRMERPVADVIGVTIRQEFKK